MNKIINCIITILFVAHLQSCQNEDAESAIDSMPSPAYEIDGQVFAIQKNRHNVVLGGVKVYFVDKARFEERLKWITAKINVSKSMMFYKQDLNDAILLINQNRYLFGGFHQREFFDSAQRHIDNARNTLNKSPLLASMYRIQEISETMELGSKRNMDFDYTYWASAALFGSWLENNCFSATTTDADGRFTMTLPSNSSGYIISHAERAVYVTKFENYAWIYEVSNAISTPVHLTTNNLLDAEQIAIFTDSFSDVAYYSIEDLCNDYDLPKLDIFDEISENLTTAYRKLNAISINLDRIRELRSEIADIETMSEP